MANNKAQSATSQRCARCRHNQLFSAHCEMVASLSSGCTLWLTIRHKVPLHNDARIAGNQLFMANREHDLVGYVAEGGADESLATASYYGVAVVKKSQCDANSDLAFDKASLRVGALILCGGGTTLV